MALRDWMAGVTTVATSATVNPDPGRSVATVATVAGVEAAATGPSVATVATVATPGRSAELRELVGIVAADWPDDERADALAAALADPEAALVCFRALAAECRGATAGRQEPAPADMRPCVDCASYTPSGRCLAAWRGESFGAGIATSRTWTPAMTDRPQRCGAYSPGPHDPDRRMGRERWPFLFAPTPIETQCAHARPRARE